MKKSKRFIALDIARLVALLFFISYHFFLKDNSGFYRSVVIDTPFEFLALFIRNLGNCCIPIFLLITGYLKSKDFISKEYYKKLLKILYVYVIAMTINYTFFHFWEGQDLNLIKLIEDILLFKDSAWYIAMYLELCLIIPFLNIIVERIDKKTFNIFILSLMTMIVLPSIFNIWNINYGLSWFIPPVSDVYGYNNIVSTFWISIYPIFYYFVGAYFRKFGSNLSVRKNILIFLISFIVSCLFNVYRFYGNVLFSQLFLEYSGWQCISISISLFMLLLKIKEVKNSFIEKAIIKMSNLELGAYLCSPVIERIVYYFFKSRTSNPMVTFKYFILVVLVIFVGSLFISEIISLIQKFINYISKNVKILILTLFFLAFILCIYKVYNENNWMKKSFVQVIGDMRTGTLFDPYVFYDNDKYIMIVSKRNDKSIIAYISEDGYNWSNDYINILSPLGDELLNRATIVKYENKYYLYYTKQYYINEEMHSDIYYTIGSYDNENNKYIFDGDRNIVFSYQIIDGIDSVMNPSVLYDEKEHIFKMWFAAGETIEPDNIYYATSKNGKEWNLYSNNPVFEKNRNIKTYDFYKVGGPNVIMYNNKYILFYIGYTDLETGRIMKAVSDDGINWERNNVVLIKPSLFGFDSESVYKPTVIYNNSKKEWMLFYNGRNRGEYIGMYTCKNCKIEGN